VTGRTPSPRANASARHHPIVMPVLVTGFRVFLGLDTAPQLERERLLCTRPLLEGT